jgi:hypothetical protein
MSDFPRWFRLLLFFSGWIAAVFVGLLTLPGKINLVFDDTPKAYEKVSNWWNLNTKISGTWTSDVEGWIDATDEDRRLVGGDEGPVIIQIRVYGGVAEGEIVSEGLKKNYVFSRIFLKGFEHGGGRIDGVVYDYIGGEQRSLARIQINYAKSDSRESLRFATLEQGGKFLPLEARLHREDKELPSGDLNVDLLKSVIESHRKSKK